MPDRTKAKEAAKHIPAKKHKGIISISTHTTLAGYELSSVQKSQIDAINSQFGMRTNGGKTKKPDGRKKGNKK